MKRTFIILSFLQCSITNVLAQDSLKFEKYYPKPKITAIEILLGPNSSTIRGINPSVSSLGGGVYHNNTVMSKIGFSGGVGVVHNFSNHFELSARLLWERKGVEEKTDSIAITSSGTLIGNGTIASRNTQNDYITISIMPQLLLGKHARINIGVGGYSSVLKESRIVDEYVYPSPHSAYSRGNYDKYDFGLSFNIGYTFPLVKNVFSIQFLNSYGINQISSLGSNYPSFPSLYNNSYSLMLGIRFSKKKFKLTQLK